jgi:hypothetical protein
LKERYNTKERKERKEERATLEGGREEKVGEISY